MDLCDAPIVFTLTSFVDPLKGLLTIMKFSKKSKDAIATEVGEIQQKKPSYCWLKVLGVAVVLSAVGLGIYFGLFYGRMY